MVTFLCGCTSKLVLPTKLYTLATFDSVGWDDDGFLVCAIHRARRYGWRTLPTRRFPLAGSKKGETIERPDHSLAGFSDVEIERYVVLGEIPGRKVA